MAESDGKRDWLDSLQGETSFSGLPRPELNPLVNPLLGENMGRWAQVYFTSPPEQREQAVEKLLEELQAEAGGQRAAPQTSMPIDRAVAASDFTDSTTPANSNVASNKKIGVDLGTNDLPMPQFTTKKPEPVEVHANGSLICAVCDHKNAAEQRFCGICGAPLAHSPAAREMQRQPVREPIPQPAARTRDPESDWQWLQQRNLAHLETVEEAKGGSRFLLGLVVLGLIIGVGYFLWHNQSSGQQPARAPSQPAAEQDSAPKNPVAPSSAPASAGKTTEAKPVKPARQASDSPPRQPPASTSRDSISQIAPSAGSGQDELEQARRYLNGNRVPKNSWMASQWLWKAVAKHNSDAVLLLSDLYARGDGVPRSCEQARILLVASVKKGSSAAAQKLRSIETSCR